MTLAAPRICCLDLDAFFVSVERLLGPRLAHELFLSARTRRVPIRLLGTCLSSLVAHDAQLCLFDETAPLHRAVDGIRERFGFDALPIAHATPQRDK